jgi:CubicO group peptidase (beta-lactamase class C family)
MLGMRCHHIFLFFLLTAICLPSLSQSPSSNNPAGNWQTVAPESEGFSSARLEILRAWLKTEPTSSMMVIMNGKVIFSYGDVTHASKIASVRKSVLSMLMGKYVVSGQIDMSKTVKQLGLDDKIPFTPLEASATLEQLMAARSGIYRDLPTDDATRQQPSRGSVHPGTFFSYNNWEFDAAGVAFEKLTGKNIYDALQSDLAIPLGMQDFHRELQHKIPEPASIHPEYAMFLSTRDMARLGLVMFNHGAWNGKQVIDSNWVDYSTKPITPWDEMEPPLLRLRGNPDRWGFGAGWWVWDATFFPGNISESPFQGAYEARGTGGQYITVIPSRGLILVHKTDIDADPKANLTDWPTITSMVLAASCKDIHCRSLASCKDIHCRSLDSTASK